MVGRYSTFRNNSAEYGGGILAQTGILNFSGSNTFGNNSAARYGGGIVVVYNTHMKFNGNSIFKNNSANREGGGIYVAVLTSLEIIFSEKTQVRLVEESMQKQVF